MFVLIIESFQRSCSMEDHKEEKYSCIRHPRENIELAHASVVENPTMFISRRF